MYSVEPYPEVRDQMAALPSDARAGYDDAVKVMELVPWNGKPINEDNPDAQVRQLVFDPDGDGMVTYLIPPTRHTPPGKGFSERSCMQFAEVVEDLPTTIR